MGEYFDPGVPPPGVSESTETQGPVLQNLQGQPGPTLENL
jgi:hypothetical protein